MASPPPSVRTASGMATAAQARQQGCPGGSRYTCGHGRVQARLPHA